jgi:hypothetical protein
MKKIELITLVLIVIFGMYYIVNGVYQPKISSNIPALSPQKTVVTSPVTSTFTPVVPTVTPTFIPTQQYIQPVGTTPTISVYNTRAVAISKAIDYLNPTVKNFANQQVQHSSSGTYNLNQVADIWQSIYNQWTYVSDPPNFDYWTSASDSITNGLKGNCADYAVLNAAVIESIGGTARVVTACAPGGSPCHAYAEVLIGSSGIQSDANYICSRYNCKTINYHVFTTSSGLTQDWLNLDWSANYPGGPFFQDDGTMQIYYPNGAHLTSTG